LIERHFNAAFGLSKIYSPEENFSLSLSFRRESGQMVNGDWLSIESVPGRFFGFAL
jgi:hypothetical protein